MVQENQENGHIGRKLKSLTFYVIRSTQVNANLKEFSIFLCKECNDICPEERT